MATTSYSSQALAGASNATLSRTITPVLPPRHKPAPRFRSSVVPAQEVSAVYAAPAAPTPGLRPLPREDENSVDNVNLGNPLQRAERLSPGWLGVLADLEGVVLDYDTAEVSDRSWQQLAEEEGRKPLPAWALRKAEHMKNEQVIQEVFEWAWNRLEVARLAARREELYAEALASTSLRVSPGLPVFLDTLARLQVPIAAISSGPQRRVLSMLENAGLATRFDAVISSEDVLRGLPDPSGYLSASLSIGRPPLRCVVLASSNLSIEAAREAGMKVVALAARRPAYELTAADSVVRQVDGLSFMDLKRLFAREAGAQLVPLAEPEAQPASRWAQPTPFSDADSE
ncbi:CPLD56 [Auxenochlorella protothecoides x Auxenochlorella symbiontica]